METKLEELKTHYNNLQKDVSLLNDIKSSTKKVQIKKV